MMTNYFIKNIHNTRNVNFRHIEVKNKTLIHVLEPQSQGHALKKAPIDKTFACFSIIIVLPRSSFYCLSKYFMSCIYQYITMVKI